ncbi:outer membrane lipoprotein-sorting protein [Deinococcus metalli]|uniref:Outer membrane lipoprotein-sorting protein n=1 Tax=Deinococcus metalli TaxID=1141878 RepID=A0A7W8KK58_9DEIO|nr:hypothetical protein [Deinococcus metalli]MBB5378029.1 outer membrane lipoprotein-sorting protein [Deinococcus metalli]GHF53875.1 hypothetical protein GCM10017781_32700 [Deinococcus metalli]
MPAFLAAVFGHRLRRPSSVLVLGVLLLPGTPGLAQSGRAAPSAADLLRRAQANLDRSPWQATVTGTLTAGTATQEAEVTVQVIGGTNSVMRMEFRKPAPLAGSVTILTDTDVWTYVFVSNQVVKELRASAKLNTLTQTVAGLGDLAGLADQITLTTGPKVQTAEGTAWTLLGTPGKARLPFASAAVLILERDPRPLSVTLKDGGGTTVGTLTIRDFKRAPLTARTLLAYPSDATVVQK